MPIRYGSLWTYTEPLSTWVETVIKAALDDKMDEVLADAVDHLDLPASIDNEVVINYYVDPDRQLVIDVTVPYGIGPDVDRLLSPLDPDDPGPPVKEDVSHAASVE